MLGICIVGYCKVLVVFMVDIVGFVINSWVLRCYGEDIDRVAIAVRIMSSIVFVCYEMIFVDLIVLFDLVNWLFVFFM